MNNIRTMTARRHQARNKYVVIGRWGSTVHKTAVVQDIVAVQDTGVARVVVVRGMAIQFVQDVQAVHRAVVPGKASRRRHRAGLAVEVEVGAHSPAIVRGREKWAAEVSSRIQELVKKTDVAVSRMAHNLGCIPTWWI